MKNSALRMHSAAQCSVVSGPRPLLPPLVAVGFLITTRPPCTDHTYLAPSFIVLDCVKRTAARLLFQQSHARRRNSQHSNRRIINLFFYYVFFFHCFDAPRTTPFRARCRCGDLADSKGTQRVTWR